ncbi:MAG: tripartite tricarboxylate transporter TctB family protein [Dictyoglomaceae bacterium]
MNKADFITGITLCIISIFFIIGALRMPIDPAFGIYGHPGLSPIFFSVMLFILSFYLILRSKIKLSDIKKIINFRIEFEKRRDIKNLITALFFIILYIFLLKRIPFFILTFGFIFLFSYFFYKRKPILLSIISLIATLIIIMIFSRLFFIPMP